MTAMRIVFVHTPVPLRTVPNRGAYWRGFDVRYLAVHDNVRPMRKILWELPHWIPWLAGVLDAAGFHDLDAVELYGDCAVLDGIDEAKVTERLSQHPGEVYLFSPMTLNLPHALRTAEIVRELYPQARVVFGGIVATPAHEEVARHPAVDFVVRDRGEVALPALLRALRDKQDPGPIGNLSYVTPAGEFVASPVTYPYLDVAALPFPKVDIFPSDIGQDLRYIRQNYALGCPFTCDFCTIQTIGRKPQYFAPGRVLAEVAAYRRHYGEHHHVYFGDETFTLHTDHTLEICDSLAAAGNITFDCQTRLNCLADGRLPDALRRAGARWLEIGLESVSTDTQHAFKQHTDLAGHEETLRRLRDAGLPVCSYLVVGLPNETPSDMRRTLDWACELISRGLLYASYISVCVPYPGSPMYAHPERYGMTLRHRRFALYNEELPPVFDSASASSDEVYDVFVDGVGMLAQAMAQTPVVSFGTSPQRARYGEFYRGEDAQVRASRG